MQPGNTSDAIPTVSCVFDDTIVELLYDPATHKTDLAVASPDGWSIVGQYNAPDGSLLVPYAPTNNLIAHKCVLLPDHPVPSGGKSELRADVQAFLHRYVDLSPLFEQIAAHYVLLSWVHDAFNEIPMLRFRGAFGAGKTRALMALGSVSYRGFFTSGASTVSPIFHILDRFGGTLVLDEADLQFSDKTADLVKILNNGTMRGIPILRTVQNRHKEFNPAAFNVFGPKIIAMRGSFRDTALESRFITEQMGVRPLRTDIPIDLSASLQQEALSLRNRLLGFRFEQRFNVACDPSRAVAGVDSRLNQMALPILSLMDEPKLREEFVAMLRERNASLQVEREWAPESRVTAALRKAAQKSQANISLQDIARYANADRQELPMTSREIGRVLRDLSVPLRKSHGIIVVPKEAARCFAA